MTFTNTLFCKQTSKVLNYVDSMFTPPYFIFFMGVWAYLRHFINLRILYSLFPYDLPFITAPANEFATVGSYTLDFPSQQYKCWISQAITFCLLAVLQAVNVFWFFLICRILARFLFKGVQKDERSDDEEEDEEESETTPASANEVADEKTKMNGNATKPKVMLNGHPVSPSENGTPVASSVETTDGGQKATPRRSARHT